MLKYVLLATSVAIASPAFAQDAPPAPATAATQQTPPDQSAPPPAESKQTAPTPTPQPDTAAAQPTPADLAAASAQPATAQTDPATPAQPATAAAAPTPAQPATSESQVAQVVGSEFGTYDKDASGTLNKAEFSTWLVALRKASDASFQGESADAKTWLNQAFTQADTDKNATITRQELTVFLTPKPA
jgi:outer membrane biosynthesis protein TonB